jgi:hypothetical protein
MVYRKRKAPAILPDSDQINAKRHRTNRVKKLSNNNKRNKPATRPCLENERKKQCMHIDVTHAYLSLNHGMVSYTTDHIQYLKETYEQRSYIGKPEYICTYCSAFFWFDERNITDSKKTKEIVYSNCCKYG